MGTKFSKTGGEPPPPSPTTPLEGGPSPPPSLKRRPSIGKRLRASFRQISSKSKLNQTATSGPEQKETKQPAPSKEQIPEIKVEIVEDDAEEVSGEVDIAAVVAQLVVEAHKKKVASRAQSKEANLDQEETKETGEDLMDQLTKADGGKEEEEEKMAMKEKNKEEKKASEEFSKEEVESEESQEITSLELNGEEMKEEKIEQTKEDNNIFEQTDEKEKGEEKTKELNLEEKKTAEQPKEGETEDEPKDNNMIAAQLLSEKNYEESNKEEEREKEKINEDDNEDEDEKNEMKEEINLKKHDEELINQSEEKDEEKTYELSVEGLTSVEGESEREEETKQAYPIKEEVEEEKEDKFKEDNLPVVHLEDNLKEENELKNEDLVSEEDKDYTNTTVADEEERTPALIGEENTSEPSEEKITEIYEENNVKHTSKEEDKLEEIKNSNELKEEEEKVETFEETNTVEIADGSLKEQHQIEEKEIDVENEEARITEENNVVGNEETKETSVISDDAEQTKNEERTKSDDPEDEAEINYSENVLLDVTTPAPATAPEAPATTPAPATAPAPDTAPEAPTTTPAPATAPEAPATAPEPTESLSENKPDISDNLTTYHEFMQQCSEDEDEDFSVYNGSVRSKLTDLTTNECDSNGDLTEEEYDGKLSEDDGKLSEDEDKDGCNSDSKKVNYKESSPDSDNEDEDKHLKDDSNKRSEKLNKEGNTKCSNSDNIDSQNNNSQELTQNEENVETEIEMNEHDKDPISETHTSKTTYVVETLPITHATPTTTTLSHQDNHKSENSEDLKLRESLFDRSQDQISDALRLIDVKVASNENDATDFYPAKSQDIGVVESFLSHEDSVTTSETKASVHVVATKAAEHELPKTIEVSGKTPEKVGRLIPTDAEGYLIPDCETKVSGQQTRSNGAAIDEDDEVFYAEETILKTKISDFGLPLHSHYDDNDVVDDDDDDEGDMKGRPLPIPTSEELGNEALQEDRAVPRISEDTETVDTRAVQPASDINYSNQLDNNRLFTLKQSFESNEEVEPVYVLAADQPEAYHDCLSQLGSGDETDAEDPLCTESRHKVEPRFSAGIGDIQDEDPFSIDYSTLDNDEGGETLFNETIKSGADHRTLMMKPFITNSDTSSTGIRSDENEHLVSFDTSCEYYPHESSLLSLNHQMEEENINHILEEEEEDGSMIIHDDVEDTRIGELCPHTVIPTQTSWLLDALEEEDEDEQVTSSDEEFNSIVAIKCSQQTKLDDEKVASHSSNSASDAFSQSESTILLPERFCQSEPMLLFSDILRQSESSNPFSDAFSQSESSTPSVFSESYDASQSRESLVTSEMDDVTSETNDLTSETSTDEGISEFSDDEPSSIVEVTKPLILPDMRGQTEA